MCLICIEWRTLETAGRRNEKHKSSKQLVGVQLSFISWKTRWFYLVLLRWYILELRSETGSSKYLVDCNKELTVPWISSLIPGRV